MKLIKALDWIIEKKPKIKVLGIDDTSILTMEELNSKAKENGWEKYVNVGVFYHQLIKRIASITALGIHVIVTAHPRIVENESGIQTTDIRTGSKFADEKVSVLGMITCLFQTYREDEELLDEGEFPFRLQVKSNADYRSVRSPFGLFDKDNYTNSFQKIIDEIQLKLA